MLGTIDALLFDLGRVVIDVDFARVHARWAELGGIPAGRFDQTKVVASEPFRQHERGEITDAAFFAHLRREYEIRLTDEQFVDGWNAIFVGEVPGIRNVLSRVQGDIPLYAFSNTNAAHQAYFSMQFADLLAPFRKIYVSNEIGARKPDAAAFRAVVVDMGIAPHRILFFDDNADNVAGARACGLLAAHVAETADVESALVRLAGGP
jgi:glucose-1-phosphatase